MTSRASLIVLLLTIIPSVLFAQGRDDDRSGTHGDEILVKEVDHGVVTVDSTWLLSRLLSCSYCTAEHRERIRQAKRGIPQYDKVRRIELQVSRRDERRFRLGLAKAKRIIEGFCAAQGKKAPGIRPKAGSGRVAVVHVFDGGCR